MSTQPPGPEPASAPEVEVDVADAVEPPGLGAAAAGAGLGAAVMAGNPRLGLNPERVVGLSARAGNATVARLLADGPAVQPRLRIQRDWRDLPIPDLPMFGPKKPAEVNWDVPAAAGGAEDLAAGWSEQPNFPSGASAHESTPELTAGKVKFQSDWTLLASSLNNCALLAARLDIKAKLPDATVSQIGGKDVPPPPKTLVPAAENKAPTGQDFQVGSIFGADNELDAKTPFDPDKLSGPDRNEYDKVVADSTKARNDREKATVGDSGVEGKLVSVKDAFSKLRQAQIKEKQAQLGAESKERAEQKSIVATEKAQVEAAVKGAEAVFSAGVKRDPVAGVAGAAGAMTALYYNDKIGQIELQMARLDTAIAELQTTYEMESVVQAKNAIEIAMKSVKAALIDLNSALAAERAAFNNLAVTIEKMGAKLGMDAESIRAARTAASALPLIEETLGNLSQVEAAAQIPTYSPQSGIGAGMVTNLDTFKTHLAQLKSYKNQVGLAKAQWTKRRAAAQKGTGVPAQTTL